MSVLTASQVEAAIQAVLTAGQKYRMPNGREVTLADLAELRALRDQLRGEEAARGSGIFSKVRFTRDG